MAQFAVMAAVELAPVVMEMAPQLLKAANMLGKMPGKGSSDSSGQQEKQSAAPNPMKMFSGMMSGGASSPMPGADLFKMLGASGSEGMPSMGDMLKMANMAQKVMKAAAPLMEVAAPLVMSMGS